MSPRVHARERASGREVAPWRDIPVPSDADEIKAVWHLARVASEQHPQAVRALFDGDRALAIGGVVQIAAGEGQAFFWGEPGLSRRAWREIWNTVHSIVWWAHERGLRVITAVVAATHLEGHRLIRRMKFEPHGWAPGFAGLATPMLRYLHIWPSIEEPALVRFQRHELWRAELAHWCPRSLEEMDRASSAPHGLPRLTTTADARLGLAGEAP